MSAICIQKIRDQASQAPLSEDCISKFCLNLKYSKQNPNRSCSNGLRMLFAEIGLFFSFGNCLKNILIIKLLLIGFFPTLLQITFPIIKNTGDKTCLTVM